MNLLSRLLQRTLLKVDKNYLPIYSAYVELNYSEGLILFCVEYLTSIGKIRVRLPMKLTIKNAPKRLKNILDKDFLLEISTILYSLSVYTYCSVKSIRGETVPCFRACIGCRNYYGVFHGSMLICAFHPYGPQGDECPDHESNLLQSRVWP